MKHETPSDGSAAKWILLALLLILLASKASFGQAIHSPGSEGETSDRSSLPTALQDGNKDNRDEGRDSDEAPKDADTPVDEKMAPQVTVAEVYKRAVDATVEVFVGDHLGGTGWLIGNEGLVITAAHVIPQHDAAVEVRSSAVGRADVTLVAVDLGHDIALLRLPQRDGGYPGLALAKAMPEVGEHTYLVGSPMYRHRIMLRGTIASPETGFECYAGRFVEVHYIAATAQPGTSGGAWMNAEGNVVGVQSGIMSQSSVPTGICFTSPLQAIRQLVESKKSTKTPTLGANVEELWQHGRETLNRYPPNTETLLIRSLVNDGPAARAGVSVWDGVTHADGKEVRVIADLLHHIRAKRPGDTVRLTLLAPDGAGTRHVDVRLACLEVNWP